MKADPANIRKLGPTLRKGEYLVGLSHDIVSGNVDMDHLATCPPDEAYEILTNVRGIGPSAAQDLIMMRGRTDSFFPSNVKKGEERGLRRWIIWSYGGDPANTSEKEFQGFIKNWDGYEAAALEFLYVNYILTEKEKNAKK
jgi:3-methyladenine DNA glycosylase/8-oxoguanine DNA glycosylase